MDLEIPFNFGFVRRSWIQIQVLTERHRGLLASTEALEG
jgi:hypothetical protein